MPDEALGYDLSLRLSEMFPDKYILETDDYEFELDEFVSLGLCAVEPDRLSHVQLKAHWNGRDLGATISVRNGAFDVLWQGQHLKIVRAGLECGTQHYIISDQPSVAKAFITAVFRAKSNVGSKILVFSRGLFTRDAGLLRQVAGAKLEDLTLTSAIRTALLEDIEGFFESQGAYEELGIPWKRGVLLLGPPGNGKTQAIRAMINRVGKTAICVRSFTPNRGTIHGAIMNVFQRAREIAPCMLILEDLDSLVDAKNRSIFLNEMDGLAQNEGILTIATTNHPTKLDPAMLNRPSRFDRKINFTLPDKAMRLEFLRSASDRFSKHCRLSEEDIEQVASRSAGFSFAYLKELCLSGQVAWMRERKPGALGAQMLEIVDALLAQMKNEPPPTTVEDSDED
jgi:hypothetical protein